MNKIIYDSLNKSSSKLPLRIKLIKLFDKYFYILFLYNILYGVLLNKQKRFLYLIINHFFINFIKIKNYFTAKKHYLNHFNKLSKNYNNFLKYLVILNFFYKYSFKKFSNLEIILKRLNKSIIFKKNKSNKIGLLKSGLSNNFKKIKSYEFKNFLNITFYNYFLFSTKKTINKLCSTNPLFCFKTLPSAPINLTNNLNIWSKLISFKPSFSFKFNKKSFKMYKYKRLKPFFYNTYADSLYLYADIYEQKMLKILSYVFSKQLKIKFLFKDNSKKTFIYNFTKNPTVLNLNLNFFVKSILNRNEISNVFSNGEKLNLIFMSNRFLVDKHNLFYLNNFGWEKKNFIFKVLKKNLTINNFYPVICTNSKVSNIFFKRFKFSFNLNYILFNNKLILNFLESFFKKKFYIKISNNYFNKIDNFYLKILIENYKNSQPIYFNNYSVSDFIEVLWYSFYLKDLTILSNWISKFMEGLNFKNHKRFVLFFQNFINKNFGLFINVLKIKGFFFDIRGKVGVTGSSKKRHFFVKFGHLSRSSKNNKTDFNQNLVRSYSGVMGVTYIISY